MSTSSIAILGCGNIGSAIAKGFKHSGMKADKITLTRRKIEHLLDLKDDGYVITEDNVSAVKKSQIIILATGPNQIMGLLDNVSPIIDEDTRSSKT